MEAEGLLDACGKCVEGGAPLGYLKGVEEGRGLQDTSREPLPPHIDTSQI